MTRPSIEDWENRQMILRRVEDEADSIQMSLSGSGNIPGREAIAQQLRNAGIDLNSAGGAAGSSWARSSIVSQLKSRSEAFSATDPFDDPDAPLKAMLNDLGRLTASIGDLDPEQAAAVFDAFVENCRHVFSDPRAIEKFAEGNYPKVMLEEVSSDLVRGLDGAAQRVAGQKVFSSLKDAGQLTSQESKPKSAYELARNLSFDQERERRLDPFKDVREKNIQPERNPESKLSLSTPLKGPS